MAETLIKIKEDPNSIVKDPLSFFGNWKNEESLQNLASKFAGADPYPHVVIDNFLDPKIANQILSEFPEEHDPNWYHYINPIEYKYARDKLELMGPTTATLLQAYCTEPFLKLMRQVTGIPNLEFDPYLHGAGLHYHPPGGRLSMHLDYSIHPLSKKERRVNIILFLNPDWKEEYNGHLEIWSPGMKECKARILPIFNRAILFRTSDESWHGLPDKIKCPEGNGRKSIAIYFVSDARPEATPRFKASFVQRPTDKFDERFETLAKLRVQRRVTDQDLLEIYGPNFKDYI